ncbi:uncharacterized protein LOC127855283 isoform X2 [Dreissena polymorpha]|uniref:uncharacterized protein LOC127855283 isoform X2 n=1 Tax=Dreissena polymorpha TaxID=45954 RepID=UPI0022656972|nr:uncharacterized protein LOC127855283 isoform X2 [Dreissena polymorpha]
MHAPRSRKESPQKPDAPSGIAARGAVDPQIDNIDWIAPSLHMRSDNIDRIVPSLHMHGDNIDRIAPSLHMRSDNIDQIAPSLHMRSDTPPSIPNAAVFSFRNNANVSQSKIKNGAVPNTDSTQRSGAKYPVRSPRYPVIATRC